MEVILASNSPRRKQLLKQIYDNFKVCPSNIDESYDSSLAIEQIPVYIASKKAIDIAKIYPNDIIISADTIVVINNQILGKPNCKKTAKKMLETLSNKTHQVITGVSIIFSGKQINFYELTQISFKELTDSEIENYILSDEPYDKAGGYAIQGKAGEFVVKIEGDYENVVGLPVKKLKQILKENGI